MPGVCCLWLLEGWLIYRLCLMVVLVSATASCGGSPPAAAPSATTSSVSVAITSPIRMGVTTQATGTATLSNGQTQSVTSGWQSDAPNIASITDAGLLTGRSNGQATIFVTSGGRQGQQLVRVVPDYQGSWSGQLSITSCTQTGLFVPTNFCGVFLVGSSNSYSLSLAQSGDSMTALLSYGSPFTSSRVPAFIAGDGTSSFVAIVSGTATIINASVSISSPSVGALTGTVNEIWTAPGSAGEGRLTQNIVGTTRTSATALSVGEGGGSRKLLLDRLVGGRP